MYELRRMQRLEVSVSFYKLISAIEALVIIGGIICISIP